MRLAQRGRAVGSQACVIAVSVVDPENHLDRPPAEVGPYPTGYIGYRIGNQYAAPVLVKIDITGKQVRGSTPWMAIAPMPVAADIITALAQLYYSRRRPATSTSGAHARAATAPGGGAIGGPCTPTPSSSRT